MKYLTPEQVLAIHDRMIKRYGGSHGLRDIGLLESAVLRPQATFGGEDLYPSLFEKAAVLMHSLLKNHQFVDGNKRTAYFSTVIFLELNGYRLQNAHKKAVAFAKKVENSSLSLEQIAAWLKKNSSKIR